MTYALLMNPHTRGTKAKKAPPLAGSRELKPQPKGNAMSTKKKASKRKATPKHTAAPKAAAKRRTARKTTTKVVYKRNPLPPRAKGIFAENIKPALIGAGGALVLDLAFAKLPIPAALKVGIVRHPVKGLGAIGLGMAAEKLGVKHDTAVALARGALTVVVHDAAKDLIRTSFPQLALEAYDADALAELAAAYDDLGEVDALDYDPVAGYADAPAYNSATA